MTLRTGPDLFDTVQLQANNIVDENTAALRIDYRFNQKHSAYFRFFRDQGIEPATRWRDGPANIDSPGAAERRLRVAVDADADSAQ